MANRMAEWLGPFIEQELDAAIAWKRGESESRNIKREPDAVKQEPRFRDDGSNLHSDVLLLDETKTLQLVFVFAVGNTAVRCVLSDGHTSVRARLSAESRNVLEKELEEAVTLDTRGDVFAVKELEVISTPYGPPEDFVLLVVHSLEYQYHLRKPVGDPRPIQERAQVRTLLEEVRSIRHVQESEDEAIEDALSPNIPSSPPVAMSQRSSQMAMPQRSPQVSSSPISGPVVTTQIPAQLPTRRRPPVPTMAHDGLEMEKGVNLDRPTAPNRTLSRATNVSESAESQKTRLLRILGNGDHASPDPTLPSETAPRSKIQDMSEQRSASEGLVPPDLPVHTAVRVPRASILAKYGRQKIPKAQQALLDKRFSWYEPGGINFPKPNVPIALLAQFNATNMPNATSLTGTQSSLNEEILWSQSQPSPEPVRRPELPPSTADSGSIQTSVPRALQSNGIRDPAEDYRELRRGHFQQQRLRKWLPENYVEAPHGSVQRIDILESYKQTFNDTSLNPNTLFQVLREIFPYLNASLTEPSEAANGRHSVIGIIGIKERHLTSTNGSHHASDTNTVAGAQWSDDGPRREPEPVAIQAEEEDADDEMVVESQRLGDEPQPEPEAMGIQAEEEDADDEMVVESMQQEQAEPPSMPGLTRFALENPSTPVRTKRQRAESEGISPKVRETPRVSRPWASAHKSEASQVPATAVEAFVQAQQREEQPVQDAMLMDELRDMVPQEYKPKPVHSDAPVQLVTTEEETTDRPTAEEGTAEERTLTAFQELVQAWQSIRPGNAWLEEASDTRQGTAKHRINVLAWDL